ncbi:hypothetical protein QE152_g1616 [Popillia japonica]|uniref:Uncharacterized protein n=1 Tax=Popillia japonica TaxID=7064 RepID=A0AAW1N605_POPJA
MDYRKRTVTIVKDDLLHRYSYYLLVFIACSFGTIKCQGVDTHGPPKVERNPIYLESFVPAGMQMIAHVTDLLKYEPTVPVTTTPTTIATPPHKPGIFAPVTPPSVGLQKWPNRVTTTTTRRPWWKLGETQNQGYFSRYKNGWSYTVSSPIEGEKSRSLNQDKVEIQDSNDLDLLGSLPIDLYKRINTIADFDDDADPFGQVQKFTDDYDDRAPPFLRKKRPPPTRAYVTLLSLYDNLNKEAKKLMLNKYSGYSKRTLEDLERFAQSTSAYQLEKILSKIVERRDISDAQTIKKISTMVEDLQMDNSYINQALVDIPPLHYDIHF